MGGMRRLGQAMAESVQRWRYVVNVVDGKVNLYFNSEDSRPLDRLKRFDPVLKCVVTLTGGLAL
jgi:hypothetical protein